MATRRKPKRTTKRRRRQPARKTSVRKTSRRKSRKTGLSELVSTAGKKAGGQSLMNGGIGGALGALSEKIMDNINLNQTQKGLVLMGAGYATASMLKKPMTGAGFSAVGAYILMSELGLSENGAMAEMDYRYAEMEALQSMPEFLDENGEEMYLQDNGEEMYLQENDEMYLQAGYGSAYGGYDV